MSAVGSFFSGLSTVQSYGFGGNADGGMQAVNQSRDALASSVTGGESMGQIAGIQSMDKAMELKGAMDKVMFEYSQGWQDQTQRMLKQNVAQRKRLMDAGATFA